MGIPKFFDRVRLTVASGNGGDGALSFHREKYRAKGGPDGGDGGNGGAVVFVAKKNLSSFSHFRGKQNFQAEHGAAGGKNRTTGRDGADLVLLVPQGTLIKSTLERAERLLFDLKTAEVPFTFLTGGRGGRGNYHFRSPTTQAPRRREKGVKGQSSEVVLEVRLIADVGLVGLPNAGKSTLLRALTNATPKVGSYPFTTLTPQLGTYFSKEGNSLFLAELPGLIAGAHCGRGLGVHFLKHLRRTAFLLYVIAITEPNAYSAFMKLQKELLLYQADLARYAFAIALSKQDLLPQAQRKNTQRRIAATFPAELQKRIFFVSGRLIADAARGTAPDGRDELTALLSALAQKKKQLEENN